MSNSLLLIPDVRAAQRGMSLVTFHDADYDPHQLTGEQVHVRKVTAGSLVTPAVAGPTPQVPHNHALRQYPHPYPTPHPDVHPTLVLTLTTRCHTRPRVIPISGNITTGVRPKNPTDPVSPSQPPSVSRSPQRQRRRRSFRVSPFQDAVYSSTTISFPVDAKNPDHRWRGTHESRELCQQSCSLYRK